MFEVAQWWGGASVVNYACVCRVLGSGNGNGGGDERLLFTNISSEMKDSNSVSSDSVN